VHRVNCVPTGKRDRGFRVYGMFAVRRERRHDEYVLIGRARRIRFNLEFETFAARSKTAALPRRRNSYYCRRYEYVYACVRGRYRAAWRRRRRRRVSTLRGQYRRTSTVRIYRLFKDETVCFFVDEYYSARGLKKKPNARGRNQYVRPRRSTRLIIDLWTVGGGRATAFPASRYEKLKGLPVCPVRTCYVIKSYARRRGRVRLGVPSWLLRDDHHDDDGGWVGYCSTASSRSFRGFFNLANRRRDGPVTTTRHNVHARAVFLDMTRVQQVSRRPAVPTETGNRTSFPKSIGFRQRGGKENVVLTLIFFFSR